MKLFGVSCTQHDRQNQNIYSKIRTGLGCRNLNSGRVSVLGKIECDKIILFACSHTPLGFHTMVRICRKHLLAIGARLITGIDSVVEKYRSKSLLAIGARPSYEKTNSKMSRWAPTRLTTAVLISSNQPGLSSVPFTLQERDGLLIAVWLRLPLGHAAPATK